MSNIIEMLKKELELDNTNIRLEASDPKDMEAVREYFRSSEKPANCRYLSLNKQFTYEDLMERSLPVYSDKNGAPQLVQVDGCFKKMCRKVAYQNLSLICDEVKKLRIKLALFGDKPANDDKANDPFSNRVSFLRRLYYLIDSGYTVSNICTQFTADDIIMESFILAAEKYDKYYYVIENTDNAPIHEIIGLSASVFDKSRRGIVNRFDTRNMNLPFYMIYNPGHVEAPNELDYYQLGFHIPENLYIINVYPVK